MATTADNPTPPAAIEPRPDVANTDTDAPTVSVLVVGYRSKQDVRDCFAGLLEHTVGTSMEVLFLDCSNDGSVEMVREAFAGVRCIDNRENLGFGRGNNTLARHARGRYLLLLNPDTLVRDDAVGRLVAFAEAHPDGGVWGGTPVLPDGRVDPGCLQGEPGLAAGLKHLFGQAGKDTTGLEREDGAWREVGAPSGAFMLVRRDLWEQLGGFDESFFMYCEETDLCLRARRMGYRVYLTPSARIVHRVGGGSAKSPQRMIALTRGGVHLTRKHFGPSYARLDIALRWVHSLSRFLGGAILVPLLGRARSRTLRQRHWPIVANPGAWVHGWVTRPEPAKPADASGRMSGPASGGKP